VDYLLVFCQLTCPLSQFFCFLIIPDLTDRPSNLIKGLDCSHSESAWLDFFCRVFLNNGRLAELQRTKPIQISKLLKIPTIFEWLDIDENA
jgi:hypothetical protein